MKIIKWVIAIAIVATGYSYVSSMTSPFVRLELNNTQIATSGSIDFLITITNYSPFPKEVYFPTEDVAVDLLVDSTENPAAVPKAGSAATVTIPPFSMIHANRSVAFTSDGTDAKIPTRLQSTQNTLSVGDGKHTVQATWGGYTSGDVSFGIL